MSRLRHNGLCASSLWTEADLGREIGEDDPYLFDSRHEFLGNSKGNFPHSGYPWVIPGEKQG